ncbi:MAG: recombinase family protein, partial [Clostridia bacterium]|nr:recombinase family protein [Clostridia bacterium]
TLTEQGIPTPSGRAVWKQKTIESILRNEKYKGSALLQKTFTVDFLEKKKKVNEGEIPQYYVEHSHPAIIDPEEWESIQRELARRKSDGRRTNNHSPFSGKIICGDCGEIYGAKVWHSTDKYRRKIWQCNAKIDNEHRCSTPHLYDKEIKEYFVTALSRLMADREALLDDIRTVYNKLTDCTAIDAKYEELLRESEVVAGLAARSLEDKISDANKYEDYANRYDELQERCNKLLKKKERRLLQADKLNRFMLEIQELDELNLEFNESLWHTTVESVTVTAEEFLIYKFRNGAEIPVQLM